MTYPAGDQPGQPQQWTQPTQAGGQGFAVPITMNQAPGAPAAGGTISLQGRPGQWIALTLWVLAAIGMSLSFSSFGVESPFGGSSDQTIDVGVGWQYALLTNQFMLLTIAAIAAGVGMFRPNLKAPMASAYVVGGSLALAGGFGLLGWLINRSPMGLAWMAPEGSGIDISASWAVGGWIIFVVVLLAFAGAVLEFTTGKRPAASAAGAVGAAPEPGAPWGTPPQQWGQPVVAPAEPEWVVESGPQSGVPYAQQPAYGAQQPDQSGSAPG